MSFVNDFSYIRHNADNEFLTTVYKMYDIHYPKFFKMDVLSKAGFLCAELLSGSLPKDRRNTGVIMMNSEASAETDAKFEETIRDPENNFPSPSLFVYTLPNIAAGEICIRHNLKGESCFFVFEKFSPKIFVDIVSDSLKFHDCLLACWADSQKTVMFSVSEKPSGQKQLIFENQTVEKIYNKC